MARRGPITIPDEEFDDRRHPVDFGDPDAVILPPKHVLDAGVAKFHELAKLNWPNREGGFKLTSFDIRNDRQLRMTLGLVFNAMLEKDNEPQ